jgi:diacylglycerol kinase (ATP)
VKNEVSNVLFIVNKFSGKGYQPGVEGKILEACEKKDVECSIEFTQGRGHATELAKNAAAEKRYDCVVAVGGDGTVNEVAQGLVHSTMAMGIIPKGSGNGLARHLCIPVSVPKSLSTLFTSQLISMDTFRMNGKLSLNVSGIGFDGHIANLFAKDKKRGFQGYTKLTLNEFFQFKEFEAEIETEEQTIKRNAFVIAIANSSQYGNNARIAPAASVCDQLLHINILKKVPPYRLDFIYSFFYGKIDKSPFCEVFQTNKMTIRLDKPMAFHIDGEPCGTSNVFTIELLPYSLKMLAPQAAVNP